jgi:hypothetical protein
LTSQKSAIANLTERAKGHCRVTAPRTAIRLHVHCIGESANDDRVGWDHQLGWDVVFRKRTKPTTNGAAAFGCHGEMRGCFLTPELTCRRVK